MIRNIDSLILKLPPLRSVGLRQISDSKIISTVSRQLTDRNGKGYQRAKLHRNYEKRAKIGD